MKLKVNEIYKSIQGESSFTGMPCTFIRLTFCNLRCSYCDTEYAFYDGKDMKIKDILSNIKKYPANLVMVTGGEPLAQNNCIDLIVELLKEKYSVMLETSGSLSLNGVPDDVIKIIDFKCPSSNMMDKNDWTILKDINKTDEMKFVIGNREDYDWSNKMIKKYNLNKICPILFSPVYNKMDVKKLSQWILDDGINARFQIQLHKYIWDAKTRGV